MPALSLTALCIKACIKNVDSLTDVGDIEYSKIKPVLARITSPEQLHEIEEASPQICGEDAELWQAFIARDVPDWRRKSYVPKNPLKWYEIYKRYIKEQNKEIELDKAKLREAMQGLKKEKEAHLTEKVTDTTRLPKLPKDPRMMANDGGVPIGGRKKGFAKPMSVLSFTSGSKTKITTPAALLTRARREAKEISTRHKLSQPTDQLKAKTRILRAPQGMINEYRSTPKSSIQIFAPRKKSGVELARDSRSAPPALDQKEQHLRALESKYNEAESYTLVSFDSDSNHSSEEDDLFGESTADSLESKKNSASNELDPSFEASPLDSRQPNHVHAMTTKPSPQSETSHQPRPQPHSSLRTKAVLQSKPHTATPMTESLSTSSGRGPSARVTTPSAPLKTILVKRKAGVDIFNRGTKRQALSRRLTG